MSALSAKLLIAAVCILTLLALLAVSSVEANPNDEQESGKGHGGNHVYGTIDIHK